MDKGDNLNTGFEIQRPVSSYKEFNVLRGGQDLLLEDMRKTLKNDVKKMLDITIPNVKNLNSRWGKEWQEVKDLPSQQTELEEKTEGEIFKIDEQSRNLTFKRKKSALDSKLGKAKEYHSKNERLSLNRSQNYKVKESMEESLFITEDRCRNFSIFWMFQKYKEDELMKELGKKKNLQKFKNKEKIL
jgi:hypothetical protein